MEIWIHIFTWWYFISNILAGYWISGSGRRIVFASLFGLGIMAGGIDHVMKEYTPQLHSTHANWLTLCFIAIPSLIGAPVYLFDVVTMDTVSMMIKTSSVLGLLYVTIHAGYHGDAVPELSWHLTHTFIHCVTLLVAYQLSHHNTRKLKSRM